MTDNIIQPIINQTSHRNGYNSWDRYRYNNDVINIPCANNNPCFCLPFAAAIPGIPQRLIDQFNTCQGSDWRYLTGGRPNTSDVCRPGGSTYSVAECIPLDPNTCQSLGDVSRTNAEWDSSKSETESRVICSYNANDFTGTQSVQDYARIFLNTSLPDDYISKNSIIFNNDILPIYCNQMINNPDGGTICPIDTNGNRMSSCSYMVADPDTVPFCATWYQNNGYGQSNSQTPPIINDTVNSYCNTNNTPDCRCINRNSQSDFMEAEAIFRQAGSIVPPSCWYVPCQENGSFLADSSVKNARCPETFCLQVIDVSGQVDSSNVQASQDCSGVSPSNGGDGISTSTIIIIVVIILIIAIILYIMFSR